MIRKFFYDLQPFDLFLVGNFSQFKLWFVCLFSVQFKVQAEGIQCESRLRSADCYESIKWQTIWTFKLLHVGTLY